MSSSTTSQRFGDHFVLVDTRTPSILDDHPTAPTMFVTHVAAASRVYQGGARIVDGGQMGAVSRTGRSHPQGRRVPGDRRPTRARPPRPQWQCA